MDSLPLWSGNLVKPADSTSVLNAYNKVQEITKETRYTEIQ